MDPASNFEAIVREHQTRVFRTLARLLGSHEHVEDLAQQVFLRLYRAMAGFRGEALLTTYLYRITVNVALDERKRRQREEYPLASITDDETRWEDRLRHDDPGPEQQVLERETHALLERSLQRLSPIERTVLVLYHQEEQSYQQIAESLRLPIGTVRTHLHRGRNRLRDALRASQEKK